MPVEGNMRWNRIQMLHECQVPGTLINSKFRSHFCGTDESYRRTTDGSRAFGLHVTDVVELGEKRVLGVDGNHFPVKLSIIDHC